MLIFREKISAIAGLLTLVLFFEHVSANLREKRFLTFPRTSPTRLQVSRVHSNEIPPEDDE